MPVSRSQILILIVLASAMALTRINHFAPIPDASWAIFFVAGFSLRPLLRWVFPMLMALAVVIDWLVIRGQGLQFWQHYCISAGYAALVPAYLVLSLGGAWLRQHLDLRAGIGQQLLHVGSALVLSVALCHLLSQGAFYWSSANVAQPSVAGWAQNYLDWFPLYLRTTVIYVALAAAVGRASVALRLARQQIAAK